MKNGKQSSFGFAATLNHPLGQPEIIIEYGLTKREYFAGLAMQGLLTRVPERESGEVALGVKESKRIVEESVFIADALLEELSKPK